MWNCIHYVVLLLLLSSHPAQALVLAPQRAVALTPISTCIQEIAFYPSSWQQYLLTLSYQQGFLKDQQLAVLPICLRLPIAAVMPLACTHQPHQAIRCDSTGRLGTRVEFTRQGKANTQGETIFLDEQDDYYVWRHELAHLVGFVDEYRLSQAQQARQCNLSAPNLAYWSTEQWQTLVPTVWPHKSMVRTFPSCHNERAKAYLLAEQWSFLQYHDIKQIEPVYLWLWQQALMHQRDINLPTLL